MATDDRKRLALTAPTPFRLLRRAARAAEQWPLAGEAVRRMRSVEDWAVSELKYRLDGLSETNDARREPPQRDNAGCRRALALLLVEADHLNFEQACERQYAAVVAQLSPDQAKMLAVLGKGGVIPLMHVGAGLPAGPIRQVVLENATSLGREAGVTLREQVPRLVGHLRALGLLRVGPEDASLKTAYELLSADTAVREAVVYVKDRLGLWPRMQRHTVGLSGFGAEFWQAVGPGL